MWHVRRSSLLFKDNKKKYLFISWCISKLHSLSFSGPFGLTYHIVRSQRGKNLIWIGGFTFCYNNHNYWVCSSKVPGCKAKLRLNHIGLITEINNDHNHPAKRYSYYKKVSGKLIHNQFKANNDFWKCRVRCKCTVFF